MYIYIYICLKTLDSSQVKRLNALGDSLRQSAEFAARLGTEVALAPVGATDETT